LVKKYKSKYLTLLYKRNHKELKKLKKRFIEDCTKTISFNFDGKEYLINVVPRISYYNGYLESHFTTTINGKKSNILAIKKIIKQINGEVR
jgi:hypothetical protein